MKNIFPFILSIFLIIISCSNDESKTDKEVEKDLTSNENLLAKTLLHTAWSSIPDIMSMSLSEMRDALIAGLNSKTGNSLASLQGMSDYDLSWGALMVKFMQDSETYSSQQLLNMSLDDLRNTLIDLNASHTQMTVSKLQAFSNAKNLNIAYHWYFEQNSSTSEMIGKFNQIAGSNSHFDLKDDQNKGMDVLRIVKADEAYIYLGVYHSMASDNLFILYLAGSNDLQNWTQITRLGDRSHQGDIEKWGDGYLVANEQDPIQGSNNIRIRYYASYAGLIEDSPANDISIPQTFSTLAEGTPDIRHVIGSSPSSSHILIGYHYYDRGIHDQLAFGILQDFTEWRTWKDEISNYNIQQMGYNGNIGGRSAFSRSGDYVLQEAQIYSGDWGSWRFLLGDGAFYYTLNPITPKGSTSFANPGITQVGPNTFAVTGYMHTAGNKEGERGELIFTVEF